MMDKVDKRDRSEVFRDRLQEAMALSGVNRSQLARETHVNRSTIAHLLAADAGRLPNAQLAADCATALGVSCDWLLGLTERKERPGDLVAAAMEATGSVTAAERTSADAQLLAWHEEARGYKVRHVPASLPDLLKTEAVLRWEYAAFLGKTPEQAVLAMQDWMSWVDRGASDYEIAVPLHELAALARGEGYYSGLGAEARRDQLEALAVQAEERYPSLRLFLFDARRLYSAPISVFGPLLGVIYLGKYYLAFRETSRVDALKAQFDWLVREAEVDARDVAGHIRGLMRSVE